MKTPLFTLAAILISILILGCGDGQTPGYTKADFAKRPAPAGYGPPKQNPSAPPAGAQPPAKK